MAETKEKKPVVRRTQEQIVEDLKAKAAAAEEKLRARHRKGFDTLHASYLKHLDAAVSAANVAREELLKLDAMAEELGLDKTTHGLGFSLAGTVDNVLEEGELVTYDFAVAQVKDEEAAGE
jgi:hypothetical protein